MAIKSRKSYTSKGSGRNVAANTLRLIRQDVSVLQKESNKRKAWKRGQNPWITIPGPAANMRFIRVRSNTIWGDPKGRGNMSGPKED